MSSCSARARLASTSWGRCEASTPTLLRPTEALAAARQAPGAAEAVTGELDSACVLWWYDQVTDGRDDLGGGPVGVELAQFFHRLGASVTLVESYDRILSRLDPEAGEWLGQLTLAVRARVPLEGPTGHDPALPDLLGGDLPSQLRPDRVGDP